MDMLTKDIAFATEGIEDKAFAEKVQRIMFDDANDLLPNPHLFEQDSPALEHVIKVYNLFAAAALVWGDSERAYRYQYFIFRHFMTLLEKKQK